MRIVTAAEIRELDRRAIHEAGAPGCVLMENAGRAVTDWLFGRFGTLKGRPAWIACGTGNNGGDGFVAARCLAMAGADVHVTVAGEPSRIAGDAKIHFNLLQAVGLSLSPKPPERAQPDWICVDALLGTGISGAPRAETAEAIEALNAIRGSGASVVAVDIPSGVDSDTGKTPGAAVTADATVTFGYPKLGLFLDRGADLAGEICVSRIGFPWESLGGESLTTWLRPADLRYLLPPRPRESHKGMFGRLLIVGGSEGMAGAPSMAARAALRTGTGLVTVAAPRTAQRIIAGKLNEAMTVALPERDGELTLEAAAMVTNLSRGMDAICVGPGMGRLPEAQAAICEILRRVDKPMVIDADGLNALAEHPGSLDGRTSPALLTPHPGECGSLLGTDSATVQADRLESVRECARKYKSVVALKGARTLICDGRRDDLPISINTTGNPGMATGGAGDTLTGIAGAFAARGMDMFDAARLSVYLHGAAGDSAAASIGRQGMVAGDVAEAVPGAITQLMAGGEH